MSLDFFVQIMVMVCPCQFCQSIGKRWKYSVSLILPWGEMEVWRVSFQASRLSELKKKRKAKEKKNKEYWVTGISFRVPTYHMLLPG